MNSLQWFKEMYLSGKLSLPMYKELLEQEITSREKDLSEIKKSLEELNKELGKGDWVGLKNSYNPTSD